MLVVLCILVDPFDFVSCALGSCVTVSTLLISFSFTLYFFVIFYAFVTLLILYCVLGAHVI